MGLTGFQLARRLAGQNVHYEAAQQIIQNEQPPERQTAEEFANMQRLPAALLLCNSADSPNDLRPIPTVGSGAGKVILRDRPDGGYSDLADLPEAIFAPPYNCDADQIAAWEG